MSQENRPPEDEQPLARPVHDQQLARPIGGEQEEEVARLAGEQREAPRTEEEQREAPGSEQEEGPISKAVRKAREKGLVDEATVEKAREKGLLDKADEAIQKARNKLTGR